MRKNEANFLLNFRWRIAYDKFVDELNQKYGDIVKWSLFSHKEVLENIKQFL